MHFRLVDITCTSRNIHFIFSNDGTFQLRVQTQVKDAELFSPYALYDIHSSHDVPSQEKISLHSVNKSDNVFSQLGVVTRQTKKSVYISSGKTQWIFPRIVCSFKPGIDVWICVTKIAES